VILLSVFWELTSIFSFLLISYWHNNSSARDGARMALTITGIGGFCLLVGLILLGNIVGSYDLDKILDSGDLIRNHDLYLPALVFILLGALNEECSVSIPFLAAECDVGTNAGVSLSTFGDDGERQAFSCSCVFGPFCREPMSGSGFFGAAGMITLLLGAYFAIFQRDLKGLLAYSTISHLGLITTLLSFGSPLATVAAIFHMLNHATSKRRCSWRPGSSIMRRVPVTCGKPERTLPLHANTPRRWLFVASAAMAGVPLLNGFLSRRCFRRGGRDPRGLHSRPHPTLRRNACRGVQRRLFAALHPYRLLRAAADGLPIKTPHEPPRWMRFPIEFLVIVCLVVGIVPALSIGPFLHTAVVSVLGPDAPEYSLSIWHGFNLPLAMSAVALVGGAFIYFLLKDYFARCDDGPPSFASLKGQRIFERVIVEVSWRWARVGERRLGTRKLQPQLRWLVVAGFAAGALPLYARGFESHALAYVGFDPFFALIWVVGICLALGTAYTAKYHRLAALVMLGGVGLVVCITFVWLSAPDLAITQLLVEIVTTVLILLGLRWLPKRSEGLGDSMTLRARFRRFRDFALAVLCGTAMSFIAYAVMTMPVPDTIANYFLDNAYTQGGGTNVVNVILVDFRGFDTLGEIAVLGVVALTVYGLLRRFRPAEDSMRMPEQQQAQNRFDDERPERSAGDTVRDYMLVPSVIMQWLFPVIITFSVYLFMRGHDLPGGGFSAGLTLSIAFLLQYLAGGTRWAEDRIRILPLRWMGAGLLAAVSTGIGSWFLGYPFLTSYSRYIDLPLIGKIPAATALLFDLGVFALVVGSTVLILVALAHQSLRVNRLRTIEAAKAEEG
jgi:multicomponent K+:H+ antiporter subunit A